MMLTGRGSTSTAPAMVNGFTTRTGPLLVRAVAFQVLWRFVPFRRVLLLLIPTSPVGVFRPFAFLAVLLLLLLL